MPRLFVDAALAVRCEAVIRLRDGTTADCGRRATRDGLCTQHYRIAHPEAAK